MFAKGNQPTDAGRIYACSSANRLLIAAIGAHNTPVKAVMGEWRSAKSWLPPNSMTRVSKPWLGVAQVFRLRRRICKPLICTQEWVYGFTSLSPKQASPQRLLELIRQHWAIENRLHRRRDVTLGEDACQVRKGVAPCILAILNSFLLALFDWLEVSNVPRQMRVYAAKPLLALRLFIESLLPEN